MRHALLPVLVALAIATSAFSVEAVTDDGGADATDGLVAIGLCPGTAIELLGPPLVNGTVVHGDLVLRGRTTSVDGTCVSGERVVVVLGTRLQGIDVKGPGTHAWQRVFAFDGAPLETYLSLQVAVNDETTRFRIWSIRFDDGEPLVQGTREAGQQADRVR